MSYRSAFPIIYTAAMGRALEFYRDGLGFAETFRFPGDSDQPVFVGLSLEDSTTVALAAQGEEPLHGLPFEPGARGFEMCVYHDDVDAAVRRLRERSYRVLAEPADQPWDERVAYVADSDGNPVLICTPTP
jgi:lactoylglutathione lyase